jgi:hypothetical protein
VRIHTGRCVAKVPKVDAVSCIRTRGEAGGKPRALEAQRARLDNQIGARQTFAIPRRTEDAGVACACIMVHMNWIEAIPTLFGVVLP